MDENNGIVTRINEFTNLLSQMYAAGNETYVEQSAFEELLEQMRETASAPTQEEINTANIDYLMMVGGEW